MLSWYEMLYANPASPDGENEKDKMDSITLLASPRFPVQAFVRDTQESTSGSLRSCSSYSLNCRRLEARLSCELRVEQSRVLPREFELQE